MKIPLSEHFHSIQGEGFWVGTPMHFLRLPGCSVGKPQGGPILATGRAAWECHAWDGQSFWCDTDFNKYEEVELSELLAETWEEHICITGGEPLLHEKIIEALYAQAEQDLHIETSGTISIELPDIIWVTCSPKLNYRAEMIQRADEVKLLVGAHTLDIWSDPILQHPMVYLSPINGIPEFVGEEFYQGFSSNSLKRAQELLQKHPGWRLSVQLHKYLGVR